MHTAWLLGALLVALALRLALWSLPLHLLANDEVEYVAVARDLAAGRGWQFYERYHWLRAPLYPLFLAGSLLLTGGDLRLAALPNLLLSTLNVLLFALIARELAPHDARRARGLALTAALLGALLLTLSTFASLYMLETLFATLLSGALLALLRYARSPRLAALALAGALLGLAALTRSLAVPLLPIAAACVLVQRVGRRAPLAQAAPALRQALVPCVVLVGAFCLVVAPWTIRNYRAYGRLIPIETGLSYNVWAFNEPREDMATIFRELEAIPNPAERADYATAKGMQRLREDPAILLRKLDDNWFALWRVKPIEDRFIQQDYYSDAGLPYFAAALVLDDALLLIILVAAAVGLVLAPGWYARLLLGGWLVATIASILLTHGEARYRHALFSTLIPYAAWTLFNAPGTMRNAKIHLLTANLRVGLALGLAALMAWTFLSAYPWQWAGRWVVRGVYGAQGDLAWWRGDQTRALAFYTQAARAQPESVDALIDLAQAQAGAGDAAAATATYQAAWRLRPTYIPASAGLGDLLRRQGELDAAREAFAGAYVDAQQVADWSWRNLAPPPAALIAVGDGLDFGYVGGVYPAEMQQGEQVRWTNGAGLLRLAAGEHPRLLRLRLASGRPEPVVALVCARDTCQPLLVEPAWRTYRVLLPPAPGAEQTIALRSEPFVGPQDGRRLGILVDWASVR